MTVILWLQRKLSLNFISYHQIPFQVYITMGTWKHLKVIGEDDNIDFY